ncbi:O-antigen ligase family protein [Acidipropionibacterium acidipropionici]|uniref:O-antigen ligase family protein n=1 Tax=Acidipropionibacterium acidipropionici TaxID=1748 RepID=UPI00110BB4AA|nr:O-antigen ligase family protein [Acidipropionibacterium acidipropionici]QCV96117.1 O-antigen ligase family protein [Acidipropionibacterium acidipropionici]
MSRAALRYSRTAPGTILGLLAALLVLRLPLSFLLFLVVPWLMALTGAIARGGRVRSLPFMALLGWCLAAAAVSIVVVHPDAVSGTGNNVAIMIAVIGCTLVVHRSQAPGVTARRTLAGLYWGALGVWLIALGEMVTGIKLLPILYPDANTVSYVQSSRFIVSATYPNINDFSVVLTMLVIAVVAKMLFDPVRGRKNAGRWFVLLTALFMVVMSTSRGALVGCLAGVALLIVLNVRRLHPHALGVRAGLFGGGLIVFVAAVFFTSSYVQDHSTATRGQIFNNAMSMLAGSPVDALLGYGSLTSYQNAAKVAFGDVLMDPHNLLLEITLNYGVIALVLFIVVWLWVLLRGFLPRRPMVDWQTAFGLTIVVLLPVLGVVPSSTLRYHVTWIYLAATTLLVAEGAEIRSATRPVPSDQEPAGRELPGPELSGATAADGDLGHAHDDHARHHAEHHSDQR